MVCVPCIFVGLAIVIWCKFLEPYIRPIYERLCQYYPPFRIIGDQMGTWAGKIERFGEKFGIRMPESCPMPKKNKNLSKPPTDDSNKLNPDLKATTTADDVDIHHRATSSPLNNE
ncbi:unnamed protein product [Rotaria magnacalcarata]|uniref:Uncharacterized protein n=1 Tax=Rotaria magnacalcarata TaxID=392030 RepID=A0A815KRT4_9BILA|nr:unnamed protein product [Rotaria magnacalcarata]CAF1400085.1 unnamed protein product [Rotaria magnacalcarata]CAF2051054.1 unnamed protein product [Rotaria magnacalcarata]CAF2098611.1 unnamed protein product [Rotaria magnacalcarata]CAF2166654.1 unnamed protein product [Rotaria magnacalcarata]